MEGALCVAGWIKFMGRRSWWHGILLKVLRQLVKIRMKKWKGRRVKEAATSIKCGAHESTFFLPQIKNLKNYKIFYASGRDLLVPVGTSIAARFQYIPEKAERTNAYADDDDTSRAIILTTSTAGRSRVKVGYFVWESPPWVPDRKL